MNRAMTPTDWSLLLAAALLLGSTFLFLNIAVAEISPLTAAAARTLIAAPLCWALMRAFGVHMPCTGQEWIALFWLGLLTAAIPPSAPSPGASSILRADSPASFSAPCRSCPSSWRLCSSPRKPSPAGVWPAP